MRNRAYSRAVWIVGLLAVASAMVWAAPVVRRRSAAAVKPKTLVVGQSLKTMVPAVPGVPGKTRALSIQEKLGLFKSAGFPGTKGVTTRARFTPSQPFIAKRGRITGYDVRRWTTDNPSDGSMPGEVTMNGKGGLIDVAFIPSRVNKPVLVVFNISSPYNTIFELWAGGQTQGLTLQSGSHNVTCFVIPTTTQMQYVTLVCKSDSHWWFQSAEVIVQD